MVKTLKVRKAPSSSATKFSVGTKRKGKDGNMWKIVKNKNGTNKNIDYKTHINKPND